MLRRSTIIRVILSTVVLAGALYLGWHSADEGIWSALSALSPSVLLAVAFALALNLLLAALRFRVISNYFGASFGALESLAIVSAGNVAGAIFFQIAGQLMARGALMSRLGSSISSAVLVTANERITAAMISLVGAGGGAFIIFGHIYFNRDAGADALLKLAVVGILALCVGTWLSGATPLILPKLNIRTARLWAVSLVLSLGVQIPMVAAYIIAAKSLSPELPVFSILAAALIVMFAASVPISLAGWGIRELSAVAALGAVGLTSAKALVVAVLIGLSSMIVAAVGAAATLPFLMFRDQHQSLRPSTNYWPQPGMLFVAVPILTAVAALFNVHLPVKENFINVNLADPVALLGGALFLTQRASLKVRARWRYRHVVAAALTAVVVLTISLVVGADRFGLTAWALTNRYLGWFVLMAYAATGALIVRELPNSGPNILAKAYIAALGGVAAIEVFLVGFSSFHKLSIEFIAPNALQGMAQNRNAFAFQILIAMALLMGLRLYRDRVFAVAAAIAATALVLTFSRSGLIAFCVLAIVPLLVRARHGWAFSLGALICIVFAFSFFRLLGEATVISQLVIDPRNLSERMLTIQGGAYLFFENPIFGAGLGAFRNEGHLSFEGQPLVIHSSFVWLLAETGLIGFVVFLFPVAYVLKREISTARTDRVSLTIVLLLTVMTVMGLPADMFYQRTFWLFIGALVAVPTGVGLLDVRTITRVKSIGRKRDEEP
ncbi:MAG: flippase-like domain-containing protein [Pseudolabrys sp.]|nr:flippase-like domain-containing protein [Pseudolabrys sp.]